ncbi:pyruvate dehydrogenase (acetyl-transferring) E1 component subunit alpha [Bacillus shivajii]|uniref:pyruvate dehydrogenase (acetyl-transferring) E1 component subunit alpha n=1 Tax=Bacillus shivajii TaxID=1983719 RepID=UPI001CFB50BB|nr:pyruvate dehydrogenase (acetyl-transferring) E1 component subunit alpha [Bacillus shivajii]UCZ55261.1 pyruvate dehydrogenase (acetyl-transferring) E1 component subunit alpha [Bacillus shivajii]
MVIKHDNVHRLSSEKDPYQVLTPEGELAFEIDGQINGALIVKMYENMQFVRTFDRKAVNLQRQGRMGTYAPFEGQEASQVGSAMALSRHDWLFPTYRDHAASLVFGQDMYRIFLYWMGHIDGGVCTEGKRILPPSVPIATQMLHAVGTAWASMLDRKQEVSIAYFGDGASSEGDFHEALNMAGVFHTPTIFFCQNNGYAISVPFNQQSASKTIAQRAGAYDMKGVRVDGNDVIAVYLTVMEAVERARKGEGPTLIEAVTYRYGAHTTADDPSKYRDQENLSIEWREKFDPITRLQKYLTNRGLLDQEREDQLLIEAERKIDEELKRAESYPKADPLKMFEHVYADTPWNIKEQQEDLRTFMTKEVKSL